MSAAIETSRSNAEPAVQSDALTALVARARVAQRAYAKWDQAGVDMAVAAAAWAILEPERNQRLAEHAVAATGLGSVADKIRKNHRKTLGLLRDLNGARSVGVLSSDPLRGLTEIARPVGVVAAITPSTNPAATPANNIINALKGGNAIILAPSPRAASTCALLLSFVHAELAKVGAPAHLVQLLPADAGKAGLAELMQQTDLVVATGSRSNVRAAYQSGTPALGVGVGNVASVVLPGANARLTAQRIVASKAFDHASSCSSENSLVVVGEAWTPLLAALLEEGAVLADADEKATLQTTLFGASGLNPHIIARPASEIATAAGLRRAAFASARVILVEEDGVGPSHPFSGEKLSPVLALFRADDFDAALALVERIYAYQGSGHSVGVHGASEGQTLRLARELPVCRVIVDQSHCFAVGGSFDNALPFSLSMGCGTWGGNSFSDNLNYRHFLNISRVVRPIPERIPVEAELLGDYWERHGR